MTSLPIPTGESEPVEPLLPVFTPSQLELAKRSVELTERSEEEVWNSRGYVSRIFTQVSLPYRDPLKKDPNLMVWERKNGPLSLAVYPGRVTGSNGERVFAYPSGRVPRLILPWLTTRIVAEQAQRESDGTLVIELGAARAFADEIGLKWGGESGKRIMREAQRLFSARFEVSEVVSRGSLRGDRRGQFLLADGWELFWGARDADEDIDSLLPSRVIMSSRFVKDVLDCPIPTDLDKLRALSKPMAMDIFIWLNYRLATARRSSVVPWDSLRWQFGAHYKETRQFKAAFIRALGDVHAVYPEARVEPEEKGLLLYPSPPATPRKRVGGSL